MRALRQRVKSHRERKALTQEEFAKACGLSRSVIANVERGAYLPGLRSRRKIAEALDVPVEELFDPPQTPRG